MASKSAPLGRTLRSPSTCCDREWASRAPWEATRPKLPPAPKLSGPSVPIPPMESKPTHDDRLAQLESVLFLANEPLSLRKIAQFARLADATEARTLIRRLNQCYDLSGYAFRVEEVAGGFQLLTRRQFGGWLRRLHQSVVETRLSSPALETMAVIAYRQPVLRATIESIRGVQCGEMLRQLMERDLVKIVGRSDELGRPFLYGTTKRFLQVFGLRRLDDLPRAEYLRASGPVPLAQIDPPPEPVTDALSDTHCHPE